MCDKRILKIIKGRLQQRGQGTDAETVISECLDEVYLVLSGCECVPFSTCIKSSESFLVVNGCSPQNDT